MMFCHSNKKVTEKSLILDTHMQCYAGEISDDKDVILGRHQDKRGLKSD